MCGIAGYYNPKINFSENPKKNINILNNMIKTMKMRGPDEDGYSVIGNCCLAHTRLSIIDLKDGKQPMKVSCHGLFYHIIFNCEIYNHPEIKDELLSLGYVFDTKYALSVSRSLRN